MITVDDIKRKKKQGEKIVMLTAYDYVFASVVDHSGVDIVLVGDSLANVVLGLDSTKEVTMDQMIHHTRAVKRGVTRSLLVGDMPYCAYQQDPALAADNARRFVEEGGCDAVKVEWFSACLNVCRQIIAAGIPVMGHVGLTPQTAEQLGGFKVQGKTVESAKDIIEQAQALEDAGCFSVVLECVPDRFAGTITRRLSIPVIGIGAGPRCDGQVLVLHDLLGLFSGHQPKFVKRYAELQQKVESGIKQYCHEVRSGIFPDAEHSYAIRDEELEKFNDQTQGDEKK